MIGTENEILRKEVEQLKAEIAGMKSILSKHGLLEDVEEKVTIHPKLTDLERKISKVLMDFQITSNLKGYRYLKNAITMAFSKSEVTNTTTVMYPEIADKYDTTPTRVERAIRHAIEKSWNNSSHQDFDLFDKKPTNSQFIAMISERLWLDLEDDESA
ncbi:sporulation initiation factor Spo0A C-terminal domain-containing protein [Oceanobacillus salinisoli]|uniref:sporulation initiation factor Spo0A C-terminal domain-containing protein n=1 Tax=Oceanobacillus salinisoli TaxID=2678611 RepID=UPI0012E29684|nr:sporulation initiation factor Spo0A C-terminal domain-containing protein [Oceanobacillus salinisoli]